MRRGHPRPARVSEAGGHARSARRSTTRLTVAIAVRPSLWGELLQLLLERERHLTVVGRAETEEALTALLDETVPDIAVLDLEAFGPGVEGLIVRLRKAFHSVRFLVLANRSGEEAVISVLRAGAAGLVAKQTDYATLVAAIRAVGQGETWAHRKAAAQALDQLADPYRGLRPGATHLTQREMEVVDGVARGLRNREIAVALGISEKTIKTHLSNVFSKLGVHGRTALALWALNQMEPKT